MLEFWYRLVDGVLPFQWVGHDFMKNALLAVLLVTPLFGLLGTMIVSNRMAFFSDSLGHGAFTGVAIGALAGSITPLWGATAFSVLFAGAITVIQNRSRASADTVIGVFSSVAVALGLVLMSVGGGFAKYQSMLVGDILSVAPVEIAALFWVLIAVLLLWVLAYNRLLLVSVNRSLAASRGVPTLALELLFTVSIAVTITITIQWVGLLIINSLLVLPAAAARNVARSSRQYHAIAVGLALFSGVAGLIASYYMGTATGATIVLVSAVLFFLTFALRRRLQA